MPVNNTHPSYAAALPAFYRERDGAFYLDAERDPELEEFRTNNVALIKENRELKERFSGIDPEEVRQLAAEKQRLEEERQLKAGEVDKVIENRVKALKADWDKQRSQLPQIRQIFSSPFSTLSRPLTPSHALSQLVKICARPNRAKTSATVRTGARKSARQNHQS